MDLNKKILIISMLVMLVCCVSAVSATDIDNTDDVSDDIVVDEVTDIVEDINVDDTQDDVVDEGNLRGNPLTVDTTTYTNYFDANGYFNDSTVDELTFDGNFGSQSYGNFKFNQSITIGATSGSTFTDVGFDLLANGITLNGVNITMTAGNTADCYAINIANSANTNVTNNIIKYTCTHDNAAIYNYAIKAINSENLTIYNNVINAALPLKTVSWSASGIAADYALGVGIQNCKNLNFRKNNVTVTANGRVGLFPTLDAVMIVGCNGAYVGDNNINEYDTVTSSSQYSYIYGVDVYQCNNITINNNTINMNADKSGGKYGGNGTGAAYCIQLTGPHTGVVISNNKLTTKNNGPNLGIYSQNYYGETSLTVVNNTIDVTGKAGTDVWSLVSGMELQDTYACVSGNTITVTDLNRGFNQNRCIYGISYSQQTSGNHTFCISNNNVTVEDGNYSVYIANAINSTVCYNNLIAHSTTGNSAVYLDTSENNNTVSNNS